MSKAIVLKEDTLKMLLSMAHQEGYKLAHQTLSDLNVKSLSNRLADKMVKSLEVAVDQNKDV